MKRWLWVLSALLTFSMLSAVFIMLLLAVSGCSDEGELPPATPISGGTSEVAVRPADKTPSAQPALDDLTKPSLAVSIAIQQKTIMATLQNTSANLPIRLWHDSNSWGYYAFSIEVKEHHTDVVHHIRRLPIAFTVNVPSYYILAAGERRQFVFNLLNEEEWAISDEVDSLANIPLMVRARFTIEATPEAEKLGVFVGEVESKWIESSPPHKWY